MTSPDGSYRPREALRRLGRVIVAILAVVAVGTAGYMIIEGWSFLESLYMTVITLSTVGYTEVRPLEEAGMVWTVIFITGGLVTFGVVAAPLAELLVEGAVRGYFRERRLRREIEDLSDHYILCGYGRVGREVAEELSTDGLKLVIIEQEEEALAEAREDGYRAIEGDASEDETLKGAGVHRARALISTADSDADNVLIVLSARKLNPQLHIVARVNSESSAHKLEIAGADRTLSPYSVGGRRLASLASRPSVVDFLDVVSRGEGGVEFRLEEFLISATSPLAGHTLGELDIARRTGARVLAIRTSNRGFDTNPGATRSISEGDILIVLGTPQQVANLEKLTES